MGLLRRTRVMEHLMSQALQWFYEGKSSFYFFCIKSNEQKHSTLSKQACYAVDNGDTEFSVIGVVDFLWIADLLAVRYFAHKAIWFILGPQKSGPMRARIRFPGIDLFLLTKLGLKCSRQVELKSIYPPYFGEIKGLRLDIRWYGAIIRHSEVLPISSTQDSFLYK